MLRPLWQHMAQVLINGDAADVLNRKTLARAKNQLHQLSDLCARDGASLELLSGTHDAGAADRRHVQLLGGRVLIMHGDAVHPSISPWAKDAEVLRQVYMAELNRLHGVQRHDLTAVLHAAEQATLSEQQSTPEPVKAGSLDMIFRPKRWLRMMSYWKAMPELIDRFVQRHQPEAQFVIVGHSHRQGIWKVGARTIVNLGAFIAPGKPWGVVLTPRELSVHAIRKSGGGFQLAPKPVRAFALVSAEQASVDRDAA